MQANGIVSILPQGWSSDDHQITIPNTQTGIVYGGSWNPASPRYLAWGQSGGASQIDLAVTGTRMDMLLRGGQIDGAFTITVDGFTFIPVVPTTTDVTVTLFQGVHKTRMVTIRCIKVCGVRLTNFATIWGRPPSIGYPPGFGPIQVLLDPQNSVDHTAYIKVDGTQKTTSVAGGYSNLSGHDGTATGGTIRFKATCRSIRLWCLNNSTGDTAYQVAVDSVPATDPISTRLIGIPSSNWGWLNVGDGFDPSAEHTYEISCASRRQLWIPWGVSVDGSVNVNALAKLTKRICFYGDSITAGTGTSNGDTCHGYAYLTAKAVGGSCRNAGLDSRTVRDVGTGSGSPGGQFAGVNATAEVTAYDITLIVILLGTNDAGDLFSSTYNASTFLTAYESMIASIRATLPTTPILCLGLFDTTKSPNSTNRSSANTQIAAAVAAAVSGGDANIYYQSTDGWITPSTDTNDGVHPNDIGVPKVVAQLSALSFFN